MLLVISILEHPSPGIRSLGRQRAIELLAGEPADKLAYAIGERTPLTNAPSLFDVVHRPRMPWSFVTDHAGRIGSHSLVELRNSTQMSELWRQHYDENGRDLRTDWLATANNLSFHPDVAIQVAILLLHQSNAHVGAVGFLQSIPPSPSSRRMKSSSIRRSALNTGSAALSACDSSPGAVGTSDGPRPSLWRRSCRGDVRTTRTSDGPLRSGSRVRTGGTRAAAWIHPVPGPWDARADT